ncbi:MAG: hypothetical protein AAGC74_10655 [Verrucomicrobiota bacterium]
MRALVVLGVWWVLAGVVLGQDPGKQEVAKLKSLLLFATDGDPARVGEGARELAEGHVERLGKLKGLQFKEYRLLGEDEQPVLRSYTNWAAPMRGSEEILLSFEPNSKASSSGLRLDLELWQSRRKVMKTTQTLREGKWLYIAGPEWRGGKLILAVELLDLASR